jgi:hypothetical protein
MICIAGYKKPQHSTSLNNSIRSDYIQKRGAQSVQNTPNVLFFDKIITLSGIQHIVPTT